MVKPLPCVFCGVAPKKAYSPKTDGWTLRHPWTLGGCPQSDLDIGEDVGGWNQAQRDHRRTLRAALPKFDAAVAEDPRRGWA